MKRWYAYTLWDEEARHEIPEWVKRRGNNCRQMLSWSKTNNHHSVKCEVCKCQKTEQGVQKKFACNEWTNRENQQATMSTPDSNPVIECFYILSWLYNITLDIGRKDKKRFPRLMRNKRNIENWKSKNKSLKTTNQNLNKNYRLYMT